MKKMLSNKMLFLATLALSLITFQAQANQAKDIQVIDPWIGAAPPGAMALGAFMILKNPTDHPITLTKVRAPGFGMVMLHKSINQNGMHKMIHVDQLVIPAHGEVALKHGSYHIMYMGIKRDVSVNTLITTQLMFKDGSVKTLNIRIEKRME